jgi:hypothetical protein
MPVLQARKTFSNPLPTERLLNSYKVSLLINYRYVLGPVGSPHPQASRLSSDLLRYQVKELSVEPFSQGFSTELLLTM